MRFDLRFASTLLITVFAALTTSAQQTAFSLLISSGGSNDEIAAVVENNAGNYITAGYAFNGSQSDIIVNEISPTGVLIQQQSYASTTNELPAALCQAAGGYYILTGAMYSSPNDYDWFVARLDASLNLVWMKRYGTTGGNDYANSCYEVSPNHFVVTGTVGLSGSARPSVVLMDSSGTVLEEGYLNTNQFASPRYRGRYLGNGELGFVNLSNSLSILDTTGAVIKQGAFSIATFTRDVVPAGNGGYAICGVAGYGSLQGAAVAFAITDSNLNNLPVTQRVNWSGYDLSAVMMHKTLSGNYAVAVNAMSLSFGNTVPLVLVFDPLGNLLSATSHLPSGTGNVSINSFMPTSDGGFIIAGATGLQAYIAKLDSSGSCFTAPVTPVVAVNPINNATLHAPYTGTISTFAPPSVSAAPVALIPAILCLTTGLENVSDDQSHVSLFPVAFTDGFYAGVASEVTGTLTVEILDLNGRQVSKSEISGNAWIAADGLPAGLYLVRVTNRDGKVMLSQKMIRNR